MLHWLVPVLVNVATSLVLETRDTLKNLAFCVSVLSSFLCITAGAGVFRLAPRERIVRVFDHVLDSSLHRDEEQRKEVD